MHRFPPMAVCLLLLLAPLAGAAEQAAVEQTAESPRPLAPTAGAELARPTAGAVLVQICEGKAGKSPWEFEPLEVATAFHEPAMMLVDTPSRYVAPGVRAERSSPFVVRASLQIRRPAGETVFLLRAKNASRLFIDGRLVAETQFLNPNADGHEQVPETPPEEPSLRRNAPGHQEVRAPVALMAGEHLVELETIVGGKGLRAEIGELCLAESRAGGPFYIVAPSEDVTSEDSASGNDDSPGPAASPAADGLPLTDEVWDSLAAASRKRIAKHNAASRQAAFAPFAGYWSERHARAARIAEQSLPAPPPPVDHLPAPYAAAVHNDLDRFLVAALAAANKPPRALVDDQAFLRRLALDTVGVGPSPEEIERFQSDPRATRRALAIDRYLADERWADHWVAYWQDVLAENPGILKPELNNSGPFRYWIHESFLDNKPLDRFATELVMMEGGVYAGGPAGFSLATQNDAPMAAKAHVLAKAFLAADMTCARCHDAPYHPFKQSQLFGLAALLERKPIRLPEASTVPVSPGARPPLVEVSLKPGDTIEPAWTLAELAPDPLPAELAPREDGASSDVDARRQLAVLLTSPENRRFALVAANRLWKRYLGAALIEPVDNWLDPQPSHPQLLDYLAGELMRSGYDLKQLARLILNSHAYQRQADDQDAAAAPPGERLFAGPQRRRLTAEQVVDSLFAAAGKPFRSEMLSLDPEGRRPASSFLNLGEPTRAWQFTSLSNERDRPALALPMAQSVVDLLTAFGWRDARPYPLTVREEAATPLQALALAHGLAGRRIASLSEDSAFTELALQEQPVEQLVERLFLRVLARRPGAEEARPFVALLSEGYAERRLPEGEATYNPPRRPWTAVSWSNHLSAKATELKQQLEQQAQAGDPPTGRLRPQWRERMEDAVWAVVNSPEFVFVP